jgi:hypothetical protein
LVIPFNARHQSSMEANQILSQRPFYRIPSSKCFSCIPLLST